MLVIAINTQLLKILQPTKVDGRTILETIAEFHFEISASLTIPANLYF